MDDYSDTHSEDTETNRKSKMNSAVAQLYRIDDLWKDSHKHSRDVNYMKWNEDLDRIWMELIADSTKQQISEIREIDKKLLKLFLYASKSSSLRRERPALYSKLLFLQKMTLMEKEAFLRVVQNEQGKGAAYEDPLDDYMG